MPRDTDVLCAHCQQYMPRSRERAHRAKLYTPSAPSPLRQPSKLRQIFDCSSDADESAVQEEGEVDDAGDMGIDDLPNREQIHLISEATGNAARGRWAYRAWSEEDSDSNPDLEGVPIEDSDDESLFDWHTSEPGLSPWDHLGEDYERDVAQVGELLHSDIKFPTDFCQPINLLNTIMLSVVHFRTRSKPIQLMRTSAKYPTHFPLIHHFPNLTQYDRV